MADTADARRQAAGQHGSGQSFFPARSEQCGNSIQLADTIGNREERSGTVELVTDAGCSLASWSTPRNEDAESAGMRHSRGTADTLTAQSSLAAWSSPSARDWKDTAEMATTGTNPDGSERSRLDQLPRQANLAGWPTPMAGSPATENYNEAGNNDSSRKTVELAGWPT